MSKIETKIEMDTEALVDELMKKIKAEICPLFGKNSSSKDIFTVEETAAYLQVDVSWVYKQVSFNKIPFFKIGKYLRFKKTDLDRWIDEESRKPVPPTYKAHRINNPKDSLLSLAVSNY